MTARQHRRVGPVAVPPAGSHRPAPTRHRRRRRRSLTGVLATSLVLGLALVACGGDDDGDETGTDSGDTTEATEATETTEAADEGGASADDETAAGDAVATVFDSSVPFDEKVALIEGGEAHRADHDGYVNAANGVGGITIEPTDVAVDGDTATVTYRVLFGGNEAYADQTMDVTRVDEAWIVPTQAFCGFLAAARTPCAAR